LKAAGELPSGLKGIAAFTGRQGVSDTAKQLAKIKTIKEVNAFFSKKSGLKFRFAEEGNIKTVKQMSRAAFDVLESNPLAKKGVNQVSSGFKGKYTYGSYNPGSKSIVFNQDMLAKGPRHMKKLLKVEQTGYLGGRSSFQAAGKVDPFRALASHETGHA